MKLPSLRLYALIAAAVCSAPALESKAAVLVYEPFDYAATPGSDRNGDGKKDLMGLAGGVGWSGVWTELTADTTALPTHPLDYVNSFELAHPSGDLRFSDGQPGSLTIQGFTVSGQPTQSFATLSRDFAAPFVLSEGTTIWLGMLLRKDFQLADTTTGGTRPADSFEIGLVRADGEGVFMGDIFDPTTPASTEFAIRSGNSVANAYLTGSGPSVGKTDFLVMKLSIASGNSRLEFFLNPSLDNLSPVPNLSLPLNDGVINSVYTGLEMNMSPSRPIWTVDEIRVGETYADVVPEPSSLLLTGFGMVMVGGARLRRSRASQN